MQDIQEIISHVKAEHVMLTYYVSDGVDDYGCNVTAVYLSGPGAFKRPNWLGAHGPADYNAKRDRDKLLAEFSNNPGKYGYGLVLGRQPGGFYIICFDIDIDNDCKEQVLEIIERVAKKHDITHFVEQTKSGRYHVFVAAKEIPESIKNIKKINYRHYDCIKYVGDKQVKGVIEVLGLDDFHTVTVYNGIINKEKPVFAMLTSSAIHSKAKLESFFLELYEELEGVDETININKLGEFYKLVRKYNIVDGWEIEKVVSAICVKNRMTEEKIHKIFKQIYGDEYNERTTENIIKLTREKEPERLPGISKVIEHFKELSKIKELTDEEKKLLEEFSSFIQQNNPLPEYLLDAERTYFIDSVEKQTKDKLKYYREWWFIERNMGRAKKVMYIEIETAYPKDIYKPHKKVGRSKFISIKIDIRRIVDDGSSRVYEVIINDDPKLIYRPSFDFQRLEDIAIDIAKKCSDLLGRFDIQLFQDYISIKLDEFYNKHGDNYQPCLFSKNTGWNDDNTLFYHYALNDEKHELSKDHILYKDHKAVLLNQKEQHNIVFDLLKEGKTLGVLLAISVSSILLTPLQLQPITVILAGDTGVGKTTAGKIATSLFYKSDGLLLNANNTKVGVELIIDALNSMPVLIDEGALLNSSADLKNLIFMVASGKGRTRGRKDLTVDIKDIQSNIFFTTETTDVDEIKRAGTFRRMLYLTIKDWTLDLTSLFTAKKGHLEIIKKYAGCGVDYIKFAIDNLGKLQELLDNEIEEFGNKYDELDAMAGTIYAGVVLFEQYYKHRFIQLRKKVDELLREAKRLFIASKDNVVEALQQYFYIYSNRINEIDQVEDDKGGFKYIVTRRATAKDVLGEYDVKDQTYYISVQGFKTIAKELEKERTLLIHELKKAGVLIEEKGKDNFMYHSKATKEKVRVYKIKFTEYNKLLDPNQEPQPPQLPAPPEPQPPQLPAPPEPQPPQLPEPQPESANDIDDAIVDAFSETTIEKQAKQKQAKQKPKIEEPKPQPKEKEKPKAKKKEEKAQAHAEAQAVGEDNNKIIINEDELNLYDVKPHEEIPKIDVQRNDLPPFSEVVIGSLDIETMGLNETDQILAIAFDVYKNGEQIEKHRFYLDEYDNDEAKMIDAFLNTLSKSDIDIVTGYNIYSFDLKMIKAKDQSNRLRFTDQVNVANVFIKGEIQQGYNIVVDGKLIEVIDAYYLVLKYDNVARDIPAQSYQLKAVAKHFGISKTDRVILGADEIREAYKNNRKLFDEYLSEDVREAYEIFRKLAPPYYYIRSITPFSLSFFDAFRLSTAAIWERILERYYDKSYIDTLTADEKKNYEGGIVIVNKGLYEHVYKIDVASLYPNIMLNYHVCSRKDTKKVALSILNEYTKLRLELKRKAKEQGDKEADLVQSALKLLINSQYGFYGTAGYLFNDQRAAAMVTAYGRKILKFMIDYVERNQGIIIECDTDGIFFSAVNGEEIYKGLKEELNRINFDIELEYKDCVMFASDKKNYIIIEPDGKIKKKGSKYAGRDKNKLWTDFIVQYVKLYVEDPAKAEEYKQEIRELIKSGKAYDLVKTTKKVGKNDKNIIIDGALKGLKLEQGSIVTYAYKNYRKRHYTFDIDEIKAYDEDYYTKEFDKLVKEIDDVIQNSG